MVADKAVYLFEHTYLLDWDINMVYVANIHMLVCGVVSAPIALPAIPYRWWSPWLYGLDGRGLD